MMRYRLYRILFLSFIAVFMINHLNGQESGYLLKGIILSKSNLPLANVSVSYEGSDKEPEISDESGAFSLEVTSGQVYLIIKPLEGFHAKRIFLNGRKNITVYMTPLDINSPDESVELSLGSKERRDIISSYSTYDLWNNFDNSNQTIDQYFKGAVPGMMVTNHSGMPGSGTTTYLRGMRSLITTNQPLYVIDGVPLETFGIFGSEIEGHTYNPLTSIEPFDIANITILKDGYATSLYGMRGSNGVVLIETLKPTKLTTTIDFSVKTGVSLVPEHNFTQLDNNQYRTYANEVLLTSSLLEENFPELYPALFSNAQSENYHRYKHNTNWQEKIFDRGLLNEVQLRIKGGDDIGRYGLSVGYLKQEGIVKTTDYDRLNIRLVGTFNIFQWLRMYISTNLNINNSNLVQSALLPQASPILTSLAKTPMMMPYAIDRNGNQLSTLDDIGSLGVSNPYSIFENSKGVVNNSHSINSVRLEGDISDKIKLSSIFGINLNILNESVFLPNYGMASYYDGIAYNVSKNVKNFLYSIYNDNRISYTPKLDDNHVMKFDFGLRFHMNRFEEDKGISKNSHENDEYTSLQHGTYYLNEIGGMNGKWNRMALYSNMNYAFKNKYLLNLSVCTENSTRLGDETNLLEIGEVPFALFYSVGGAWRLSSEDFLKDISIIDELKFRLSYSISGNDDIGNLNAINFLRVDHYRETTGVVPGNLTDGTLKHEKYSQINAGVDLSLWGNRFSTTVNYYNTNTMDMLVREPQPFYLGYNYLMRNNGLVNTQGLELGLNSRIMDRGRFIWDLSINLSPWQESVVREITDDRLVTPFPGGEYVTETGQSLLEFYGYQYEGVYSTSDEAKSAGMVNEKGIPFMAGDAKFSDISGPNGVPDNIINDYDKVSLGSPMPELFGGVSTKISYGRWSVDMDLNFVSGNNVFNYLRYENEKMSDLSNQSAHILNRWVYEGQQTTVPRALWDDPVGNSAFSSRWIEDGSYVRLQNLILSYTIPEKLWFFRNFKVFVSGSNLFTFTNYLGYDPEFSYSFQNTRQGIDYGLMPVSRSFILGVKVGL